MAMPQLPREPYDDEALTRSQLLPVMSKNISILHSRALVPLVATALTCVLLFSLMQTLQSRDDFFRYLYVLTAFLLFAMFAGLYFYVGERKHMLWYLIPAVITVAQLAFGLSPYFYVFRTLLPGDISASGFASAFTGMFFGAGLMEELLKAVPALLALLVALQLRRSHNPGGRVVRNLALEGPVDGLLIGAAAGAAFIFAETLWQYVPNTVNQILRAPKGNAGEAFLFGMLLLLPRILNGIIGHMAWAGISGYFIGLVVSHRRAWWKLLAIAWLLPATLHAFWNSSSYLLGEAGSYVSAAITLFFFAGCVLKAKQLEVSRLGGPIDGRSILAISPPAVVPAAPGGIVPPTPAGFAGALTSIATTVERAVGVTTRTTVPNPGSVPAAAAIPPAGISIGTDNVRYALAPHQPIDFSGLFGEAGVPPGFAGEIVPGEGGALDIRNTGTNTFGAATADGQTGEIPPGRAVRAAPGTRLTFGAAVIDLQAY